MKLKTKEIDFAAIPPEPTIWALRKNPRVSNAAADDHSLYEHIFGYDPIRLISGKKPQEPVEEAGRTSAENPNLSIINPETNFALMELASELEPEQP